MFLTLMTWEEVEEYLKTSTGIVMPIGSTEQHGPNGLIGTDAICAEAIGKAVGNLVSAVVGPTISVGIAQHHMGFSGSMTLRPSTLISVIVDHVNSLTRHGFDRFYFINGHGGNVSTVRAAFQEVYSQVSLGMPVNRASQSVRPRCAIRSWYEGSRVRSLAKKLYGSREGYHATPSEVSVTQFIYPDFIKNVTMKDMSTLATGFSYTDADDYRRRFPDGRMGSDPSLARPDHGEELIKIAAEDLAADYQAFLSS